jgi:hypothetical protein
MRAKIAAMAILCVFAGAAAGLVSGEARDWRSLSYRSAERGVPVSLMYAPQTLRGRLVFDTYGRPMGRVVSIDVDREGKAQVVNIEVGGLLNLGTRIMPFAADRIVYYPQKAELVASNEPPSIQAPRVEPNSPTRASVKRSAPEPTIIRR